MTYSSSSKEISYLGVSGVDLVTNSKQKYLGFNTAGSWTPVGGNLVSHDVVDLSGANSINVITDIDIETYNILIEILIPAVDTNSFINYNSNSFRLIKLRNDNLGLQRFQLVDENLDLIDLNGLSWNLSLSLTDRKQ